jgi:hypothetical protein
MRFRARERAIRWANSTGRTFIYRRQLAEVMPRNVLHCVWQNDGVISYVLCFDLACSRSLTLLKGIGINSGRARLDRRIEEGASRTEVSWEGLAHDIHGDDHQAVDRLRGKEKRSKQEAI